MRAPIRLPASIVLLACLHVAAANAADPCSYFSRKDAAALLNRAVTQVDPSAPMRDEESGGQLTFCTYRAAGSALVISIVEYPSEAAARKQVGAALMHDRLEADDAKVVEEPGIGEKAYYGQSSQATMLMFLKRNKVAGIAVGGPSAGTPPKEALRKAALSIAGKL